MAFHSWQTLVDEAGRCHGRNWRKKPTPIQYAEELKALLEFPFKHESVRGKRLIRFCLETDWAKNGRPYYNIHPQMAKKLAQTNLDKIPSKYIEIPNEYQSINLRFSEDIPTKILETGGDFYLAKAPEFENNPLGFRSALFGRYNFDNEELLQKAAPQFLGEDQLVLIVDEGCRCEVDGNEGMVQRTICNTIMLGIRSNETIPQAFERALNEAGFADGLMMTQMKDRFLNLFRVVITTGFLANCPEDQLVVPDILSKDKQKYQEALKYSNQTAIDAIVDRAQRRGKKGWNVGTDELFVGTANPRLQRGSNEEGKELQYSHIRSGHPHAVRFGKGKEQVKIKWFRPTRVREDLPFKEE